jgi:hypothetical protein
MYVFMNNRNNKNVFETWTENIFMKHIQGVSKILGENLKLIYSHQNKEENL